MRNALYEAMCRTCAEIGIVAKVVAADGNWHRTDVLDDPRGKGDGAIRIFPDGQGGQAINWKQAGEPVTFFVDENLSDNMVVNKEQLQHERETQRLEAQLLLNDRYEIASRLARAIEEACKPAPVTHAYLLKKGIRPTATLKAMPIDQLVALLGYHPRASEALLRGMILIAPILADGKTCSIEMIDENGRKTLLRGGRRRAGYWATSVMDDATHDTIVIAEGIATAISIQECTGWTTVSAGSCSNLLPAAQSIQAAWPNARLVIAADLGNGQLQAEAAAIEMKCAIAVPQFTAATLADFAQKTGKMPTDFNDLHQVVGLTAVREQFAAAVAQQLNQQAPDSLAPLATLADSGWPDPIPIASQYDYLPYPIEALPSGLKEAVMEVQAFTQAPIAMVASSALAVLSLAAQGLVNIQRAEQLLGPVSLYFLIIADSGERKSSNDGYFSGVVHDFVKEASSRLAPLAAEFRAELSRWEAQRAGLVDAIKQAARNQTETQGYEESLLALEQDKPKAPPIPRLIYKDATPEALTYGLAHEWPSAAILSSEAGGFLGSHGMGRDTAMRYFSILNELWDGQSLTFDRRTKESFTVNNARLSVALQVQEATLRTFLDQSRGLARGTGFLARFLIACPASTQGSRFFKTAPPNWPALKRFQQRILAMLQTPLPHSDNVLQPQLLSLNPKASALWIEFHNQIERSLASGGELSEMRDIGSKAADNAARLAGLFHAYAGNLHLAVDETAMAAATKIVAWHLSEARRFLSEMSTPAEISEAVQLDRWLIQQLGQTGVNEVPFSQIQQRGPNALRKKSVLQARLETLKDLNRIRSYQVGRAQWIQVNPQLLDQGSSSTLGRVGNHA